MKSQDRITKSTYLSANPWPTLYPRDSRRKKVDSRASSSSGVLSSTESSFTRRSAMGTSSIRRKSRHEAPRNREWESGMIDGEDGSKAISTEILFDGYRSDKKYAMVGYRGEEVGL